MRQVARGYHFVHNMFMFLKSMVPLMFHISMPRVRAVKHSLPEIALRAKCLKIQKFNMLQINACRLMATQLEQA